MAERIKIVIDAVDNATKPLAKVSTAMEKVGDGAHEAGAGAKSMGLRFTELSSIVGLARTGFDLVYGSMKKVYELGKEGASLEYAAGKFDRLAESAGTVSDVLLRDLRTATKGTRSDMELMAGAGDFMALGLAKSHDEIVRLTRVAGALNMDMNQLVLTLTNKTTMRFDALGVSVDGFDEKVKALEQSGLDANAAFTEAFLQQAELQIDKVGDAAETDAGKIMRMEAATKNLSDAFKVMLAPAIADVSETIADAITKNQRLTDSLDILYEKYLSGELTLEEYRKEIGLVSDKLDEERSRFEMLLEGLGGYNEKTADARIETYLLSEELDGIIQKWRDAPPILADMNDQLFITAEDAAPPAAAGLFAVGDEAEKANQKIDSLITNSLKPLTAEMLNNKIMATLTGGALLEYAVATGQIDQKTYGTLRALEVLTQRFDINKDGVIDVTEATDEYWDALDRLDGKTADTYVNDHKTTIHQDVYLSPIYSGGKDYSTGLSTNEGKEAYSHGANFVVPPGYPNDSYGPIYVESGEHVNITPANEVLKDMRTFNFNYSGNATMQQMRQSYEMARLME